MLSSGGVLKGRAFKAGVYMNRRRAWEISSCVSRERMIKHCVRLSLEEREEA